MKKLLFVWIMALAFVACKEKETKTEPEGPTQMQQVMAVHDELMPKMSTIGELIGKIEANIDSTNVDSVKVKAVTDLKAANRSMMTWMKDFGNAFETDEIMNGAPLSEDKQKTLDAFEKSVNELKAQMDGAIENAQGAMH
ncbi:MAG TPA: hypothetical protein PKW08_02195 [Flavobacteriaceae bacterium]|nr:hypothetical protein [Flavobacteriaceae bacterium]HPF10881.1 hypothetical protein [Flavobacteriaceae bacterium]HQU20376.1 hypothetical protein [Flavobacteriaceae bacterium]HQU64268.1 hypothetical protein [Flavobacteriaceae bacterium]HRW44279.1 hypothetical protein [Flavobacteriaceae bacterium]